MLRDDQPMLHKNICIICVLKSPYNFPSTSIPDTVPCARVQPLRSKAPKANSSEEYMSVVDM